MVIGGAICHYTQDTALIIYINDTCASIGFAKHAKLSFNPEKSAYITLKSLETKTPSSSPTLAQMWDKRKEE